MKKVRVGVVGISNMGSRHAQNIFDGNVPGAELTAVCDISEDRLKWAKEVFGEKVKIFDNVEAMYASGSIDGVIIATPHYHHPSQSIKAFEHGLHVLVEKPAGVYTKNVREMNAVAEKSGKVFCIMYSQRTKPVYQKLKDIMDSGELGELKRTVWIITNWYRSQSYYDSGGWRATWEGEGGGVLLNQCPHNLDIWQWTCGMPKRVRAFCSYGKYHDIEVEDDVTAFVEYENGATGVFITSTHETPGTNRLEITGDRGKLVVENDEITFWRLRVPERQFNREYTKGFGQPEHWVCKIPVKGTTTSHVGIMTNWVEAIQKGKKLLAPGIEGINGLLISNAMHLSDWTDSWVEIPFDEDLFYDLLQEKIKNSKGKKKAEDRTLDVTNSYGR